MFQVLAELSPHFHCLAIFKVVLIMVLLLWDACFKDGTLLPFFAFWITVASFLGETGRCHRGASSC